jgi:low temperature requirement protein LtrA
MLRRSVTGLAVGTAIGIGLLIGGALIGGTAQAVIWVIALVLDMAGPYLFGSEGWRFVPEHFAERHGLIIIIALGESIVAIGAGANTDLTAGVAVAAVLGVALVAAMWWLYFDVVALVSARRLASVEEGRARNELARDSYSYLHFPMVAGIVLVALGMKKTLGDVEEPLEAVPAFALLGGLAMYLMAHVGFRYRHVRTINTRRGLLAVILLALVPLAVEIPALATLTIATGLLWILIVIETRSYGEARARVRHEAFAPEPTAAATTPDRQGGAI